MEYVIYIFHFHWLLIENIHIYNINKLRKEELERKRQKLAELRRSREERKNALLNAQKKETVIIKNKNFIFMNIYLWIYIHN